MAATIKDVAKRAGVGVGTVSRVLNDEKTVSSETKDSILRAIAELNYIPNRMAVKLRRNESKIIALLVPIIDHPFFSKLTCVIEAELDKYGYSLMLVSSQQRIEKEQEVLERLSRREVDGVIFVTHFQHDKLVFDGRPIISIDRHLSESTPYVTSNNYEASVGAIEYLIKAGCKKIGYVGSKSLVESEVARRIDAYKDVITKHGMEECIIDKHILHGEEGVVATEFFDNYAGVDGVFVSGYTMAQAVYDKALERGINIPNQLQMVSFDGTFRLWDGSFVTSVEQPIDEMGKTAVKLMLSKIKDEDIPIRTELKSTFVAGSTTKN